ncbi:hypothetical protein ABIE08_004753, partial [Kaistia defluvii]
QNSLVTEAPALVDLLSDIVKRRFIPSALHQGTSPDLQA